jgi:nitronate monooxygenase
VGIKVFCDVTDLRFAQKVEALGADAVIAVNNEAGGHRGELSPKDLIELLRANCTIPVISAGGVGNKAELDQMLAYGAEGVSVGSPFIASVEAPITDAYKQACVDYGAKDIVLTERISGTPCTVINTPYVQKIGTRSPWLERMLNKNRRPEEVGEDAPLLYRHEGHGTGRPTSHLQDGLGGRAEHWAYKSGGTGGRDHW